MERRDILKGIAIAGAAATAAATALSARIHALLSSAAAAELSVVAAVCVDANVDATRLLAAARARICAAGASVRGGFWLDP